MGAIMTLVVRPMTHQDLNQVVSLEARDQPAPWSEKIFQDELAAPNRTYLVAEDDVVIGFGGVMVVDSDAHVTNLLVAPEARRAGIGIALMSALIDASVDMGAVNLTLEVRSKNQPARSLYALFGLAPVGVRKGYYGSDDALIMWAHDIADDEYRHRLESLNTGHQQPKADSSPGGSRQ